MTADADALRRARQRRPTVDGGGPAWAVPFVATAAAVGATSASAAPTGVAWVDIGYRALLAAFVVLLGRRSSRWTWPIALLPAALSTDPVVIASTVTTLAVLVLSLRDRLGRELAGAIASGLVIQVQLRLGSIGPDGATLAIGVAALAPMLLSGWNHARIEDRRVLRRVAIVATAVVIAVGATAAVTMLGAKSDAAQAMEFTSLAADAAAAGDYDTTRLRLADASRSMATARHRSESPMVSLGRGIPLIGQNVWATREVITLSSEVLRTGSQAVRSVDEAARSGLTDESARDASATIESLVHSVDRLDSGAGRLTSIPWLLPPVQRSLDEVRAETTAIRPTLDGLEIAIDTLPTVLGHEGVRRYGVIFANPAEARELGGFAGALALITISDGELTHEMTLRARDIAVERSAVDPSLPNRFRSYEPWAHAQNLTGTPDFEVTTRATAAIVEAATGQPIDGLVYLDTAALAALLELTGPVTVEDFDVELTEQNAADFLNRDQYLRWEDRRDRVRFSEAALDRTMEALAAADWSPFDLYEALKTVVAEDRLLFRPTNEPEAAAMDPLGLAGPRVEVAGQDDLLSVMTVNAGPNKLDAYLHRTITFTASYADTGATTAQVRVRLDNAAGADLPPAAAGNLHERPNGTWRGFVLCYSRHPTVSDRTREGDVITSFVERGRWRHEILVEVGPETGRAVTIELQGELDPGPHRLRIEHQPLVTTDRVILDIDDGAALLQQELSLTRDRWVDLPARAG